MLENTKNMTSNSNSVRPEKFHPHICGWHGKDMCRQISIKLWYNFFGECLDNLVCKTFIGGEAKLESCWILPFCGQIP